MVDIGLMRHLTGMPVDVEYGCADLLNIYRGAVAEQFVGQEMILSQKDDLYYWSRRAKSSSAEVDYVAVIDGRIYPIEVKSGVSGRLKSLHLFLQTYRNSSKGIVFSTRPYAELPENNIVFVPLYFAFSATRGSSGLWPLWHHRSLKTNDPFSQNPLFHGSSIPTFQLGRSPKFIYFALPRIHKISSTLNAVSP
jgi:hypothetical protein